MRATKLLLASCILIPMLGCVGLHDVHYELTQRSRTNAAWRSLPDCAKQSQYPLDYQRGWKDGFFDVTTGGTGCPPVVAPSCYWHPSQILDHCDNRRHAYYSGFQDGAAHASRFPDTHTLRPWGSCDCPLPSNQCCPTGTCGCPIGSCGLSSASETTTSSLVANKVQKDAPELFEMDLTGSQKPFDQPLVQSGPQADPAAAAPTHAAPPVPMEMVGSELLVDESPKQSAKSETSAPKQEIAVATAPVMPLATTSTTEQSAATNPTPADVKRDEPSSESTVKQAAPFVLEDQSATGTVRQASKIQLPN